MDQMNQKKVGPTDFQAEVEKLKASGKMPALHELLGAVGEAREKFAPQILKAREKGEDNASND